MSELPEVEAIARLMELAARYGLEELEAEEGGLRVRLSAPLDLPTGPETELASAGRYRLWSPPSLIMGEPEAGASTRSETARPIPAPLGGTVYRAPSPSEPSFVEVGAHVEEGQVVCLIEAMKVYSEVHAEFAGRVVEVLAQNGQLVQHGDVLFYVDPD